MNSFEAHEGYPRVVMDCCQTLNPHDVVHGIAIFALMDQAFGLAANCRNAVRVAVSVHIQYIAPATGTLVAIANHITGQWPTLNIPGNGLCRETHYCRI